MVNLRTTGLFVGKEHSIQHGTLFLKKMTTHEQMSDVASFFIFVYKYGTQIKNKLCENMKRKPTYEEILQQWHFAFYHMQRIRRIRKLKMKIHKNKKQYTSSELCMM